MIYIEFSTHLLSVGYSSVVTTSREFQAEILRPLYRQSMKIIIDSLVPNHRKKQLMPDSTMEPPAGHDTTHLLHQRHKIASFTSPEVTHIQRPTSEDVKTFCKRKGCYL